MQRLTHPCCNALASAMLVVLPLVATPQALHAQEALDVSVRDWERRSVEARVRSEQRWRLEQSRAHAQMPDTMYASTPDPSTPPHPFPIEVELKSAPERVGAQASARSATRLGHRIAFFPAALRWAGERGYQGFARVINRSEAAGEVRIEAVDDAGVEHGPVTLAVGAGETVHFNSEDLEEGSARKGLSGGTGAGEGDWRLELSSALDVEVLSYIRTKDGFLTAMHDVVGASETGHWVPTFNPGGNVNQVSWLRVMNPGEKPARVTIEGIDDKGESSAAAAVVSVPAGAARTLSAQELERGGSGFVGALGDGAGKWQLMVSSGQAVEVMSLLSSPTGHRTNLSTVVGSGDAVALFPAASRWAQGEYQGFARIINRSERSGVVRIEAVDDAGMEHGPVTLAIGAGETVHFNSDDLEEGSARKGLSGETGAGTGDWRLAFTSGLDIEVLSYIRTEDGFLTAMHDVAPESAGTHRVVVFNPGGNRNQVSRLRVVNPGEENARVRIEGIDDEGASPGDAVEFTLPGGRSRTLSAQELESGDARGLSAGLGGGKGKWRLAVTANQSIEVMSLLSSPTGHVTNLSTVRGPVVKETAEEVFREHISGPVVQGKCIACHVEGGLSGNTRLVFVPLTTANHEADNLKVFEDFIAEVDEGATLILNKIQGVAHGGGVQVAAGTPEFADMERFLGLLGEDVTSAPLTPQTLFDTVTMAPARKVLRRAALVFAGRLPTEQEYAAAERGADALRATIRGFMTGPEFREFLIRASNDRLLTDKTAGEPLINHESDVQFVDFINEAYRRKKSAFENGDALAIQEFWDWTGSVMHGLRRAPLELIAHVVKNNRPYTEILTANYVMANPWAATAYGAKTRFNDPGDVHEFKPSRIVSYYRQDEGLKHEHDPHLMATQIYDAGSLKTIYPHAGILNTKVFLQRYPTTATNRNRARSRWTHYHFLGLDIEKSASRTTDPVALADTNNPTMHNPACTVCHRIMDPVAGVFQNYGDEGLYRDQWGGLDSLDGFYKEAGGEERAIHADTWESRETLSWPVSLATGAQRLRVLYTNDYYDPDTGDDGYVYLDRLRVTDARGGVIVSHEFEDLGSPIPYQGQNEYSCGDRRRNSSGQYDHLAMWNGGTDCAFFIDVEPPIDGVYHVEIVAWMSGRHELYGEDEVAKLSVAVNAYEGGDAWYRDMRKPGFNGKLTPNSDNSVQWLATQIVADERFAEATVKFWWPAIMGSEVAEPPENEGDADFEGLLLAANAQGAEVTRLANGFRRGFQGSSAYNLKDLLIEIVLSKWFRANTVEDANPVRNVALRDAGARRLLTPEELARKTASLTGIQWGREFPISDPSRGNINALSGEYRLLYGGIDSDGITERSRDVTSVMAGVASRHAAEVSCPIVLRDFYLVPEAERRLFSESDITARPGVEFETSFEIEATWSEPETHSLKGPLTAGAKTVRLTYTNDYWDENTDTHRDVYVDRLDVRNAAGRVVESRELEELGPSGNCNRAEDDHYALWCSGSLDVPIDIPDSGIYTVEIVVWANHAGDELPRLIVAVESAAGSAGEIVIRNKLVELHDVLLGVQVTPHSPDVEAAYRLFVDEMNRAREAHDTWFNPWECGWAWDQSFFDGILDGAVVEYEDDETGWRWYNYDWNRLSDLFDTRDWSDLHHTAQAWVVVLAYLLMDYRYLYL